MPQRLRQCRKGVKIIRTSYAIFLDTGLFCGYNVYMATTKNNHKETFIWLRISKDQHREAKELARREGRTLSGLVRFALERYIDNTRQAS